MVLGVAIGAGTVAICGGATTVSALPRGGRLSDCGGNISMVGFSPMAPSLSLIVEMATHPFAPGHCFDQRDIGVELVLERARLFGLPVVVGNRLARVDELV